jgi:hypothetical protein
VKPKKESSNVALKARAYPTTDLQQRAHGPCRATTGTCAHNINRNQEETKKMKTTDLYDDRVRSITTQGLNASGCFCDLRVDAGLAKEDPDHSRGYVRLELDRVNGKSNGGVAAHLLRAAAVHNGELKDVLELHTLGDSEAETLARALIFAGEQLLRGIDPKSLEHYAPTRAGVLHDSPSGSVWQEAK